MINDSINRYGSITRFFHWLVAVLVFQQFFKFADRINDGKHWLGDTFGPYHVSIGAIIMILAILRLLWSMKQKNQRPIIEGANSKLVKAVHGIMYFCLIAMPPLGALYIHGHGYPVKVFGQILIEKPADKVQWAHDIGELHSVLAIVLAILVVGHIGAALYHHFIRKDDTLRRMA